MEVNEKKEIKSMTTRQRDLGEFMYFFEWGVHMALAFLVILLLGIMTDVWGNLAKAQDEAETIEEAIVRLIGIHEAEPTSHTGDGEAIDVHRKNEIIDHPAQSVVLDKIPFTQYDEFKADLGSHGWSYETGSGTANDTHVSWSLFSISALDLIGNTNHLGGANYPDMDLMYQFKLALNGHQYTDGTMVFAWTNDDYEASNRMTIEKDGTNFYWRLYRSGSVVAEYNLSVGAFWNKYVRIWFESATDTVHLYIGSTEVLAYVDANWRDFVFPYFSAHASRSTNNQIGMTITDWKMSSNLNVD